MKKLSILLIGLMLLVLATPTLAAKPTEAGIYHCGCVALDEKSAEATAELQWSLLIINSKSRGHRMHQMGDTETCTYLDIDEIEQEIELDRSSRDCEVDTLLVGVDQCDAGTDFGDVFATPTPGATCEL